MENALYFNIGTEQFSVVELLDKKMDHPEVLRLISSLKRYDDSYIVHEPIPEDIIESNDNWSCHSAEKLGLSIEFICCELLDITFRNDLFSFNGLIAESNNIRIVKRNWLDLNYTCFISKNKLKDGLWPNRRVSIDLYD